jgi:hypothetical protein
VSSCDDSEAASESTYQSTAVELDHNWRLSGLEVFRHDDTNFDFMFADLLIRSPKYVETVESIGFRRVVKGCHVVVLILPSSEVTSKCCKRC